jgi:hypothetical protein
MSKKDKPLPKPPSTPFGRKRAFQGDENSGPLMADKMAMAMSAGKLDEFLKKELPDSEHARKLAEMMMGMTGMMPAGGVSGSTAIKKETPEQTGPVKQGEQSSSLQPPEDMLNAVRSGDVRSVMEVLAREHAKRTGAPVTDIDQGEKTADVHSPEVPVIDKDIIDKLIKIASDNNTSIDWLFFRALKRYVEEYKKTGNL